MIGADVVESGIIGVSLRKERGPLLNVRREASKKYICLRKHSINYSYF